MRKKIRLVKIFAMALSLTFSLSCSGFKPFGLAGKDDIIKSPNDAREYRSLVLNNQLEVLLISDPQTERAAAALDVRVGQFNDPRERPGLSHFLEHMLFLGNEKYPKANSFGKFLSSRGGYSNAYTSLLDTNYFFSAHKDYLEDSLDHFSQFFISPLFNEEFVNREIKAVESEHRKNLKNDWRRIYQVLRSVSNPDHPFNKFGTGNLETLGGSGVDRGALRGELIKFYGERYSANLMKLVILGKESLDDLEAWAVKYFSPVKNKNIKAESFSHIPLINAPLPRKVYIEPVKVTRLLRLMFPLPPLKKFYKSAPGETTGHLLGHESEGSVLACLKNKGWATSLSAGVNSTGAEFSFLGINIMLTDKGLGRVDDIVKLVFQYMELIKKSDALTMYFNELKKISLINFRFQDKEQPEYYAARLSSALQYIPVREVVAVGRVYQAFDLDLEKEILARLTPQNLQITLAAPKVPVAKIEKWYQVAYDVAPVEKSVVERWKNPGENRNLKLPGPNPFIPERVDLKPELIKEDAPVLLKKSERVKIWYKADERFKKPKGNILIRLSAPQAYNSVKNAVLSRLFTLLLKEELRDYSYPAALAGLGYSATNSTRGIELSIGGYSENIPLLFSKIVEAMSDFKIDDQRFKIFKKQIKEEYQNEKFSQAFHRARYETHYFLSEVLWHTDEYLAVIDKFSADDLRLFVPGLLENVGVELLAHGNFSVKEIYELGETLEKKLINRSLNPPTLARNKTILIPDGDKLVFQLSAEDVNSAVQVYFQAGEKNVRRTVVLDMLGQIISKPFYHQLRTMEQLGYLVWSGYHRDNNVEGFNFLIQSSVKDPVYLLERVDHFIVGFAETLKNISPEEFEQFKQMLIAKRVRPPQNLGEETHFYWGVISSGEYDFKHREKEVNELKKLKLSDTVDFYREMFLSPKAKKFALQVFGKRRKLVKSSGRLIKNLKKYKKKMNVYPNPLSKVDLKVYLKDAS